MVFFLATFSPKSEPFQSAGTPGKYLLFIFGIFQFVGGACQTGDHENSWYAERGEKNVRFYQETLVPVFLCEIQEIEWEEQWLASGCFRQWWMLRGQKACVRVPKCFHLISWIDTENWSLRCQILWSVHILAFLWMGRFSFSHLESLVVKWLAVIKVTNLALEIF